MNELCCCPSYSLTYEAFQKDTNWQFVLLLVAALGIMISKVYCKTLQGNLLQYK